MSGAGMVQWREHLAPTSVSLKPEPAVIWVECVAGSALIPREVFLQVLPYPLLFSRTK